MKRAALLLLAISACVTDEPPTPVSPQAALAPPGPSPLERLDEMESHRTLKSGDVELVALVSSSDAHLRRRALDVVARLQRPETVDAVAAELASTRDVIPAAFAAGQLGLSWQPLEKPQLAKLTTAVLGALPNAANPDARVALDDALGKLGQPEGAPALIGALGDPEAKVRRAAAQSLGLLAYATKGASPDKGAIDPLGSLLAHDADADVRYAAGYALMRSKKPEAQPALVFGLKDSDARVRAVCARGLADGTAVPDANYLVERLKDPELDVRVESARSLAKRVGRCKDATCPEKAIVQTALKEVLAGFDPAHGESAMPVLAIAQEKLPAFLAADLSKASESLPAAKGNEDALVRGVVGCYLAAAADRTRTDGTTPAIDKCPATIDQAAWREALAVRTLGDSEAQPPVKVKALLARAVWSAGAQGAVDDALGEAKVDAPEVRTRVLRDLRSADWGVTLSAADAAGKLALKDAVPDLVRALTVASVNEQHDSVATVLGHLASLKALDAKAATRFALDSRATVRAGARDALKTLGAPLPQGEPEPLDFHLQRLQGEKVARIATSRGEIRMRLHAGSFTAENFADLAERGYFDQLTFHRVVPGFVVQGGDPRGDGAGGPGYSIPCEIDGSRYVRGAVGMALAGKDTGGSQFFITLTPQPHLEGRYTIFADVISGMEVADQLVEGDRILAVTLEGPADVPAH
ncbi:MAG: peptidylprolyl isomerase [Deltaproteobacteria bacterium]|nr:peptidylprolyl isomerase [Deltaproteobacteria bacterium]